MIKAIFQFVSNIMGNLAGTLGRRELTSKERELLADLYHFITHNDEEECLAELKEEKYKRLLNVDITARVSWSCRCEKYKRLNKLRDNDTVAAVECIIRTGYCRHARESVDLMSFQIIHLAAIYGMTCVLEYLLTSCKVKVNCLTGPWELPPVFHAVFYGNETTALYLLDMGGANHPNGKLFLNTLLTNAIIKRCDQVVKRLLRDKTCDVNGTDYDGRLALKVAVRDRPVSQDTKDLVTLLIDAGCDVNIKNYRGRTALFYAIKHKDVGMVEILLKAGASVNVENNEGRCPLTYAVSKSNIEITELILEAGADPNSRDGYDDFALLLASDHGDVDMCRLLLKHKADVNIKDCDRTALFDAVEHKDFSIVEILLKAGASVNVEDNEGMSPLIRAVKQSRELTSKERELLADLYHFITHNDEEECLAELKEEKYKRLLNVDITARVSWSCRCEKYKRLNKLRDNDTVAAVECIIRTGYCRHARESVDLMSFQIIHLAAIYGMTCVLEYLLTSCKVKVNCLTGPWELPPVFHAVFYGNETTALYLLDMGGANHPNGKLFLNTLLTNAIIKRCDQVVKRLLRDKTCDVNGTDYDGRLALKVAVRDRPVSQDTKDLVTLLIDAGCDVNIKNYRGRTALFYAIKHKDVGMVEILLKAGASVNVENNEGRCPLTYAVSKSNIEITELILEAGADPNSRDGYDDFALLLASDHGDVDMCRLLLKHKADVNIKDCDRTALFDAVEHKDFSIVEILLKAGASVNVEDNEGMSPLIRAVKQSTIEITELILEAGADPNSRHKGVPALTVAANAGEGDMVCLLLKHKADVNATNLNDRDSALHEAAWDGHKACVKYLLEAGANHDQRALDGNTPMSAAAQSGHPDVIDMLLPLGCDVTNADKDLDTPLHYAAFNGCLKTVAALIVAGANVNAKNTCDATPLWNAVHKGHTHVVRYLVRKNADLNVPSRRIDYLMTLENPTYIYDEPKTPLATVFDNTWAGDDILIELLLMAGYDIWHEKGLIELTTTPISSSSDVQTVFQTIISHVFTPPSLFHLCKMSLRNTHKLRLEEFMRKQKIPKTITNNIILEGIEKYSQKIPVDSFGRIF